MNHQAVKEKEGNMKKVKGRKEIPISLSLIFLLSDLLSSWNSFAQQQGKEDGFRHYCLYTLHQNR